MYGLPANVKADKSNVPRFPLEVGNGPVQVPVLSGVPPSNPNKFTGGVVVN